MVIDREVKRGGLGDLCSKTPPRKKKKAREAAERRRRTLAKLATTQTPTGKLTSSLERAARSHAPSFDSVRPLRTHFVKAFSTPRAQWCTHFIRFVRSLRLLPSIVSLYPLHEFINHIQGGKMFSGCSS